MAPDHYPEVIALRKALIDRGLQLSVGPEDRRLASRSYRRIRLTSPLGEPELSIPVDDEYEDADDGNPALLLHLVLAECETYEQAEDMLVWAKDVGLDGSEDWVRAVYAELGEVVPKVREAVGPGVHPLSAYDFTLNTGPAQALRRI